MNILGLMSGTSMDGVDICMTSLKIDKNNNIKYQIITSSYIPYDSKTRKIIHDAIFYKSYSIDFVDSYLGKLFSDIIVREIQNKNIDLISSHGQTLSHKDKEYSVQVGNPRMICQKTNIPVVSNFRQDDIALGGNGAPLMPILDWFLFKNSNTNIISINIGGISNLSLISRNIKKNNIIGFDMGPGMCLIDRYVRENWNKKYDKEGLLCSYGNINIELLNFLMHDPIINKKPPKSISTESYGDEYINKINSKFPDINNYDILRTLVNFTADSIFNNIKKHVVCNYLERYELIISGGGIKNKILLSDLKKNFKGINVSNLDMNGLNIDNKEAFLMCLLGYTKIMNIPNNLPSVTGASMETVCGTLYES